MLSNLPSIVSLFAVTGKHMEFMITLFNHWTFLHRYAASAGQDLYCITPFPLSTESFA